MADTDTELQLKKRARRRLVGAAALALLAAVVLPLVMEREPKPLNQDVQIRIPSVDGPATRLLPGKPQEPLSQALPAPAEPSAAKAGAAVDGVKPVAPVVGQSSATPEPTKLPAKESVKAPEKPQDKLSEKVAESPPPSKAQEGAKAPDKAANVVKDAPKAGKELGKDGKDAKAKAEAARADAILNGKDPDGAERGFVVQVGVFSEASRVRFLKDKIKGEGLAAFSEAVHTDKGDKYRLKAGPFPTREAANKAKEKLKRIGLDSMVVSR